MPTLIANLRELLGRFPKLYVDLSWVVYDQYLVLEGQAEDGWLALITEFPDRFMVGSDVVASMTSYVSTMTRYYVILDALAPRRRNKTLRVRTS